VLIDESQDPKNELALSKKPYEMEGIVDDGNARNMMRRQVPGRYLKRRVWSHRQWTRIHDIAHRESSDRLLQTGTQIMCDQCRLVQA
jgi:hypothetical protein